MLPAGNLLGLLFDPEDGDNTFLRTVGELPQDFRHHIQEDSTVRSPAVRTAVPTPSCADFYRMNGTALTER
jgi:hypothetical protein